MFVSPTLKPYAYLLAVSCHRMHLVCVMRLLCHSAGRRSDPRIKLVTIFDRRRRRWVLIKPAGAWLSEAVGAGCFEVPLVVGSCRSRRPRETSFALTGGSGSNARVRSLHNALE